MLRRIDSYIIKKFLGTFFFALLLIIVIILVFTYSEEADNFEYHNAPSSEILVYYLTLAPYFATLFSPMFTFIAVIFFTSKMAFDSELIGMFSNGISFTRLLRPYFIGAFVISMFSFILTNYVLPSTNEIKNRIYCTYVDTNKKYMTKNSDIHLQLEKDFFIHISSYSQKSQKARRVTLEKFENGTLKSSLYAREMNWDAESRKWQLEDYRVRDIDNLSEIMTKGFKLDTTLNLSPKDFLIQDNTTESMTLGELNQFIKDQQIKGTNNVAEYQINKYTRFANPLATFILTVIGVSLSSRKIRGGIGLHLGLGLLIAFSYLLLMRISTVFAAKGSINPLLAVWSPNIIYSFIAYFLYKYAKR